MTICVDNEHGFCVGYVFCFWRKDGAVTKREDKHDLLI